MIQSVLSIVAVCIFVAEFWTGIAVHGWNGGFMVVVREKSPGPYWFIMVLQSLIGVVSLLLAAVLRSSLHVQG